MKTIFVVWGITGLALAFCFAINLEWAWTGLLIISVGVAVVPGSGNRPECVANHTADRN